MLKYGSQRSNQLRGARGASAHACSTGLSTGRRLMPMTARCGAAAPCRGAATVRQLPTRGKWWEAAGCVELTERVQLQPHAKLVAIQTEACPAVRSTQPANALHVLLYKIHTVSRWKRRCNCLDCHEFSSTPLRFRPHPRMPMQLSFRPCPRMQLQLHALCALSTTRCVCGNCLTVVAPRHGAAAPHRAVMGIKRRPVERPVEHACAEAPRAPRN
jgi:hypothetical protein